MREKIVAVIFAIIIVAIPLVTIAKKAFIKEEPQITEEGSIAELNREEQLYMQLALEQNGMTEGTDENGETQATPTPEPKIKDTYQPGTVTTDSFTSEWMNLSFTRQKGFELGTEDGLEMYARCVDGARVEVYTEPVPEEYMDLSDLDYLSVLMDKLLDADYKILDQSKDFGGNIGTEYYAGINLKV